MTDFTPDGFRKLANRYHVASKESVALHQAADALDQRGRGLGNRSRRAAEVWRRGPAGQYAMADEKGAQVENETRGTLVPERAAMNHPLDGIKAAVAALGEHARQEHLQIITEERDRWRRQSRIAWAYGTVGWALLTVSLALR